MPATSWAISERWLDAELAGPLRDGRLGPGSLKQRHGVLDSAEADQVLGQDDAAGVVLLEDSDSLLDAADVDQAAASGQALAQAVSEAKDAAIAVLPEADAAA